MEEYKSNGIFVTGIEGSGRKCLVSAVMHKMAVNTAVADGNRWELSAMEKDTETLEDGALIFEHLRSYKTIEKFSLEKTALDPMFELPRSAELELKINGENCGRIRLINTDSNSTEIKEKDDVSAVLFAVDCGKILENDREYISESLELLKSISNAENRRRTAFALTKADILDDEMRKNNFRKFYELFEKNGEPVVSYCIHNAIVFTYRAVSAFCEHREKVFGSDGKFLESPDFSPWNTENLLADVLSLSVSVIREKLIEDINYCNDVVMRRKSIFNSGNRRAEIELYNARKLLCRSVKDLYPFDNAVKYIKKI